MARWLPAGSWIDPSGRCQQLLHDDLQFQPGELRAGAHMDAAAGKEIGGRIAVEAEFIGVAERFFVAVGRGPDQRDPFVGLDPAAADLHRPRRHPPVGDERRMHAQYLVDGGRQQARVVAKLPLDLRVRRQIMREDAYAGRDGAELSDRPVAQDADDLVMAERPAVDLLPQKIGGNVVGSGDTCDAAHVEQIGDVTVEFERHRGHGFAVPRQRRLVVPAHPSQQRLVQCGGPAEIGALDAHGEGAGEAGHQIGFHALFHSCNQFRRDRPTLWFEGGDACGFEMPFQQAPVGRVLRRVHAARNRQIAGSCAAEGVVILKDARHICVAEQRPAQIIAICHRTPTAHGVIGGDLVGEDCT